MLLEAFNDTVGQVFDKTVDKDENKNCSFRFFMIVSEILSTFKAK